MHVLQNVSPIENGVQTITRMKEAATGYGSETVAAMGDWMKVPRPAI